jgi:hypothetical protein
MISLPQAKKILNLPVPSGHVAGSALCPGIATQMGVAWQVS